MWKHPTLPNPPSFVAEELERREKVNDEPLVDSYGRHINYLRISLTELCNFRCIYCMPPEGISLLPPSEYLTRQEITRFVTIAGRLGITRIRLTGGEPLLREDILEIIRSLKAIKTVKDLSITTNGSRLAPLVGPLREAGLDRINISLDSLDRGRFQEITRRDVYEKVIEATFAALSAGFPVKLNVVVLRGITEEEILKFVQLACDYPLEVRFLEFMPLCGKGWQTNLFLPIDEVRQIVRNHFNLVEELPRGDRVAETFVLSDGKGKVGFIASLSESFCDRCSRMRLTANGKIRPCLFSDLEVSVKDLLRRMAPDQEIIEAVRQAVWMKPRGNWFQDHPLRPDKENTLVFESLPSIRVLGG